MHVPWSVAVTYPTIDPTIPGLKAGRAEDSSILCFSLLRKQNCILTPFLIVSILLINAVAILSEDRFLARGMLPSSPCLPSRPFYTTTNTIPNQPHQTKACTDEFFYIVGWSNSVSEPAFGSSSGGDLSIKSKLINLMTSVRTLMRSTFFSFPPPSFPWASWTCLRFYCIYINWKKDVKRGGTNECVTVPLIMINSVIIVYELALG